MEATAILVGSKKPITNYVLAALTQFNQGNEVVLKARGKAISRAVDVAELLRNQFIKELVPKNITIGTDELQVDGKKFNVSTISIVLSKPIFGGPGA